LELTALADGTRAPWFGDTVELTSP
jgi:hypothetical protein